MAEYNAPLRDMRFVIEEVVGLEDVATLPGYEEATPELLASILEEAGRLASGALAPLNRSGDLQGARWSPDGVRAPDGFAGAYQAFVEGGWNGITGDPEYGGMGLPELVAVAAQEIWQSANMAFALCPLLTAGAVELLRLHGTPQQQARYLGRLVSGEWTGTMALTEPQAGSDLAAVRTRAVPDGDHYRLFGQKIYITWGEHDLAENIIHFVLARTPHAPPGVKGISLFLVPRRLVGEDGEAGAANDVRCTGLEHKLGIHASPTCTLVFGDGDGAIGYRVGPEGGGLACMFTMMNEARHKVGVQGLAIAERAYQQAVAYARGRVQGQPPGSGPETVASILGHPDVRRLLMAQRARIEAMRLLCYQTAGDMDRARRAPDPDTRARAQTRVDLLIPVVKAWCTDLGVECTSLALQVHGGMGYVEETGVAQHYRDARITPIYEGTNGIQAIDLVGRKLLRDRGQGLEALLEDMEATVAELDAAGESDLSEPLAEAVAELRCTALWLLNEGARDPLQPLAGATEFLQLTGTTVGGWLMGRAALAARSGPARHPDDGDFYSAKQFTIRFYMDHILNLTGSSGRSIRNGAAAIMALPADRF